MPKIRFANRVIECEVNANLRRVLMAAGLPLYHPMARPIHCRGLGTCGTCAVKIKGEVSETTKIERWRLSFPPHQSGSGLRLACQCQVRGDIEVEKWDGFWGNRAIEHTDRAAQEEMGVPRRSDAKEIIDSRSGTPSSER